MGARKPDRSYWEGRGAFGTPPADIEYFVHAGESGPDERQRGLYRQIEKKFDQLFAAIAPLLRSEYEASIDRVCPSDVASIFHLDSLSVPPMESPDMEWEIGFACEDGEDWLFTVHMTGWQPTSVSVMH